MSMRAKTILLIILTIFVTTAAMFLSSLYFTNRSMKKMLEQDLEFAIGIADNLVSMQMRLMKANAATLAGRLSKVESPTEMTELMAVIAKENISGLPPISSMLVFGRDGAVASYGIPLHGDELAMREDYRNRMYHGDGVISSPFHVSATDEYVMNVYTPMDSDLILAITIPSSTFTDVFARHRLWQTGNIFMLTEDGGFVGAADPAIASASPLIQRMMDSENGVDNFSFQGEEHLCAYTRIEGSSLGWRIAVSAPLDESPQSDAFKGHVYSALFFLVIGAASAFFLSTLTAKPFHRIEAQNRDLETLNQTIRAHSATLQQEYERILLLLDATPLACRLWDSEHNLIECNEAVVTLFGLTDKQEYLERYSELAPEYQPDGQKTSDRANALIGEAVEQGVCEYEWTYQMPDGTPIPAECVMVRVPYGDDYVIAGYSRDLREQKKMISEIESRDELLQTALKEAERANVAKTNFLAQMSHEIRTPLNAVVGLSELALGNPELEDDMEDKLEKIHFSGMTILSIVNDILDISKIESGKFELYPTQYDTPSLINDILTLNIVRIGEKPIEFHLRVDEDLPGVLYGDDIRVKQVFNNLLSNAFKYTNSGKVEWLVAFERDGADVWMTSRVCDTGIGIKPEGLQKLFTDYNQVDVQTNRKVEGTGLGLAITKRLVDMMDGTITVESEYGKGTTFHVRLRQGFVIDKPIGRAVAENLMSLRYTHGKRTMSKTVSHPDLSYAHVLVVDDIVTNLDVVKGMMKPYKIKIDCAMSGRQAIEMVRAGNPRYDAIFMDHMMPEMDGIEAACAIRGEIGTEYAKNVPIIALTANAIVGNEEMFLGQGFQAFLSKPIDTARLDAILRRFVRDKDLERDALDADGRVSSQEGSDADGASSFLAGLTIDGMDVGKALARFNGDEAVLMDILHSYATGTRPLLNDLREYMEEGELADYAIAIHGIKGSSYALYAQEVGKMAEELEHLAKTGNLEAVKDGHPSFEAIVVALLDGVDHALDNGSTSERKPTAAMPDLMLLNELIEACAAFNMDGVDSAMEQLESFQYESGGELVAWLREQVNNMTFEDISSLDLSGRDETNN